MLRISRLPAFMIPESRFTWRITFGHQTLFAHHCENVLQLLLELFDTTDEFLQMQMTLVVDHLSLVEDAAHVALELLVIMDFAIAELHNGLCGNLL